MFSTNSSEMPGSKNQFMYSVPGVSALCSLERAGLNGAVRAQLVWGTRRDYAAYAFDAVRHAVAVAEDDDAAPQIVRCVARVVAGDVSLHS